MAKKPFRGTPDTPDFRGTLIASRDDEDFLNHINNVVYLRWVQDMATAHSKAVNWDLPEYEKIGGVWVVRQHDIVYLRSAKGGDEIELVTWTETLKGASHIRKTQIFRKEDRTELARCSTTWVLLNNKTGRPIRIPQEIVQGFKVDPGPTVELYPAK
ncbi:MAG: acyl-CoA thioesterase [Deltaproteobacteria bacterium]|nr:acyl-CoA thioesterase [Deltaproteobacteria bacterium]